MLKGRANRSSLYSSFAKAYDKHRKQRYAVDEGVVLTRCSRCHRDTVITQIEQRRSADEEATEVKSCLICDAT